MKPLSAALALPLAALLGCHATEDSRRVDDDIVYNVAEGAIGPYSGSVIAGGVCYVSGKIGERGDTFEHEVETALDAVEQELDRVGLGLDDVVAATVYLTDMDDYGAVNEIYGRRFTAPYPARACIAVAELPAGARVEIQVTARMPR